MSAWVSFWRTARRRLALRGDGGAVLVEFAVAGAILALMVAFLVANRGGGGELAQQRVERLAVVFATLRSSRDTDQITYGLGHERRARAARLILNREPTDALSDVSWRVFYASEHIQEAGGPAGRPVWEHNLAGCTVTADNPIRRSGQLREIMVTAPDGTMIMDINANARNFLAINSPSRTDELIVARVCVGDIWAEHFVYYPIEDGRPPGSLNP